MKADAATVGKINAMLASGQAVEHCKITRIDDPFPPRQMAEKKFMWKVINYAEDHGWRYWHVLHPQGSPPGLVDLILVRERVVWIELKSEKGKLRKAQEEWIAALKSAKQEVYLWRPSNWPQIEEILR